jgi:hypothetical protein
MVRLTARGVYFAGTALLTAAAATEGLVSALVTAGLLLILYAFCRFVADN